MDNPAPAAPAVPAHAPAEPMTEPANDAGFGDFGGEEMPTEDPMGGAPAEDPSSDMPFEKEPFDAGIEADEETDPKKFIEQLSGKLGQSLRQFAKDNGQPDFELEKFAINSVISATHTAQMDEEDKNDIIKKINKSGEDETQDFGDDNQDDTDGGNDSFGGPDNGGGDSDELDFSSDEEPVQEDSFSIYEREDLFLSEPKKNNMFQPGSNDILDEMKPCWKGYKQVGMKEKNGKEVPNCVPVNEESKGLWANIHAKKERGESPAKPSDEDYPDKKQWDKLTKEAEGESNNYMFWQNLKTIHHASGELLEMNQEEVDSMIANGHAWAVDHISTSADDIEEVYHFMEANLEDSGDYDGETEGGYEDEYGNVERMVAEGKYDGKPLGKPMKGDVKKFKVYVKNAKGNVIKVNFGDPNMEIKRDNPERRKSFRARHKCSQAKDRTTPKYWSCKMWSKKPVSKIVEFDKSAKKQFSKDLQHDVDYLKYKEKDNEFGVPNALTNDPFIKKTKYTRVGKEDSRDVRRKTMGEGLNNSENFSIFDKKDIKMILQETFNHEEPLVLPAEPKTKPKESPMIQPSRRNKPFLPERETQPDPKAEN